MEYGGEQMAPLSLSCIPLKFLKSDFVFIYNIQTYFSNPWVVATNDAESCWVALNHDTDFLLKRGDHALWFLTKLLGPQSSFFFRNTQGSCMRKVLIDNQPSGTSNPLQT